MRNIGVAVLFRTQIHFAGSVCLIVLILLEAAIASSQAANPPRITLQPVTEKGWRRVGGTAEASQIYTLLSSSNLTTWSPIATLIEGTPAPQGEAFSFSFADPAAPFFSKRFYRLQVAAPTPANDWKNQLYFPADSFAVRNAPTAAPGWVKFAIILNDPFRVYYQDSTKYLFHYDFAANRLGPFRGLSRAAFDQISLHLADHQVVLGAILYPPNPARRELGIQFTGLDPYPPERVRQWFDLVRSTLVSPPETVLYFPTFEQRASAEAHRDYFAANGIALGSTDAWLDSGDQTYSPGWALGRLKYFPATGIRDAFNDGRLRSEDILLTDGVPAEIPLIAGLITLLPATPNAHVAILARSQGVPFVFLANPESRAWARRLVGKQIVLRARLPGYGSDVKILEVEGQLSPELEAELLALKVPVRLELTPKARLGALSAATTKLLPGDLKYFGGKAANFALLRRTVPDNSPPAIAFSFDLWDEFLDQTLPDGKMLRAQINERLAGFRYPPDLASLRTNLAAIRSLIRNTARFSPAQRQAIIASLTEAGFAPDRKIRFRSSTNLEDTESFVGAGLYDSYSGCLGDDLDSDDAGPSGCDPSEPEERGVFRALQRVYASFYNDDAVIDRMRLGVDDSQAGMGVLVHYSFPDEIEMANGVATIDGGTAASGMFKARLNTQKGAVSVTNPDGKSQAELISVTRFSFGTYLSLEQASNLVPLGGYVLAESEYHALMDLLVKVARGYSDLFPGKRQFTLDLEYKKVQPGRLEIKQVRELPPPSAPYDGPAFLINQPVLFSAWQGECSSVFSLHRLKCQLRLETLNAQLDPVRKSFYGRVSFEFLEGGGVRTLEGPFADFPSRVHGIDGATVKDGWTLGTGADRRDYELLTNGALPQPGAGSASDPIAVLGDFQLQLSATYAQPVFDIEPGGKQTPVTNDTVCLLPVQAVRPEDPLKTVTHAGKNGWSIETSFFTPAVAESFIIKTVPLLEWKQTTLRGLIQTPVLLTNPYAQTFRPAHHNFAEDFIFEPRLDPGVPASQLEQLAAANIRLFYLHKVHIGPDSRVFVRGFDATVRELK